jgi:hypothetical protein
MLALYRHNSPAITIVGVKTRNRLNSIEGVRERRGPPYLIAMPRAVEMPTTFAIKVRFEEFAITDVVSSRLIF